MTDEEIQASPIREIVQAWGREMKSATALRYLRRPAAQNRTATVRAVCSGRRRVLITDGPPSRKARGNTLAASSSIRGPEGSRRCAPAGGVEVRRTRTTPDRGPGQVLGRAWGLDAVGANRRPHPGRARPRVRPVFRGGIRPGWWCLNPRLSVTSTSPRMRVQEALP